MRLGMLWSLTGFPALAGPVICGGESGYISVTGVKAEIVSACYSGSWEIQLCGHLFGNDDDLRRLDRRFANRLAVSVREGSREEKGNGYRARSD